MKSNKLKYIVIILFVSFLFIGAVFTTLNFGDTFSWFENRSLNEMPTASSEGIMDGKYFTNLEKFLADRAAMRNILLRVKAFSDNTIFDRPNVNDIVIEDDILLMYRDYSYSNAHKYSEEWYAGEMAKFNDIVTSYGGYFCYVAVPTQYDFYADLYPDYLENMVEETEEKKGLFSAFAKNNGVPYLDMGPILKNANNSDELFFKTDHHYTLRGAYLTYTSIIDKINADCDANLTYPLETNGEISFSEIPNNYVGSYSRKVFALSSVSEHLTRATFRVDIPFKRYDNGIESYPYVYAAPADTETDLLYSYYMGGDVANTVIDTDRDELPSILIYGDSFTNALECILYYSFDEMHSVDLRHYSDMTLLEYVDLYKPDYVICVRDYDNLVMPYANGDVFGNFQ